MATILAHIRVREGAERRFEEIARGLYEGTHRLERGVRRYEYWRGAEPRSYYTLLAFDDFHAFIAHQTSPHHESASPDLGAVIEDLRLEWLDPVADASPLPETRAQDVGDDAGELARRYAEVFAADVAAWWLPLR